MSTFNLLPNELNYEIALRVSGENLVSLCSSSPTFFEICSDSYFWRKKFAQDGIPLLFPQDKSGEEWIKLYEYSFFVMQEVYLSLQKKVNFFNLGRFSSPEVFSSLPNRASILEAWERLRYLYILRKDFRRGQISREEYERLSTSRYSGILRISKKDNHYVVTVTISRPGKVLEEFSTTLTPEEAKRFLFTLYFYLDLEDN